MEENDKNNKNDKNEEKNDENKVQNENEIQNYKLKIKELNSKINVLIKGIKEEREKTKKLTNDIEVLNLDKIVKEETISKLKNENESLNSILSKDDPKSYFENITKLNTDINFNPEEYNSMKKENVQLKEECKKLMQQNSELIIKIEKITEEKQLMENKFNEEIYKLKKERIDLSNDICEKQKRIEILNNLYKEIEEQKNNKENEIINYKKNSENLENQIKILKNMNDQNLIKINKLNQEIEERIKIKIDNYIFKGKIIEDNFNQEELYNKKIEIKFSSTDINIQLNFDDKNLEIDVKNIKFNFDDKEKDKVIILYEIDEEIEEDKEKNKEENKITNREDNNINNENNIINNNKNKEKKTKKGEGKKKKKLIKVTNAMLCQFSERECEYIYKFKKEMIEKYKENKKNKQNEENEENNLSQFIFGIL